VTILSLVESAVIAFLGASDGATHAALGMHAATLTAACVVSCLADCAATWAACTIGLTEPKAEQSEVGLVNWVWELYAWRRKASRRS
jgi:hypothetical protein